MKVLKTEISIIIMNKKSRRIAIAIIAVTVLLMVFLPTVTSEHHKYILYPYEDAKCAARCVTSSSNRLRGDISSEIPVQVTIYYWDNKQWNLIYNKEGCSHQIDEQFGRVTLMVIVTNNCADSVAISYYLKVGHASLVFSSIPFTVTV